METPIRLLGPDLPHDSNFDIDNDIGFDTIFDGQQLCRGNNAQIGIINLTCDPRMIIDIRLL